MRLLHVIAVCVVLQWSSVIAYASEPAVEQSQNKMRHDSGDYALSSFLYWKPQLMLLANEQTMEANGSSHSALFLRLRSIEEQLLIRRKQGKPEDWEELEELANGLNAEHPLRWYSYYYHGLQLFAQQRYREADWRLQKAYGVAKATGNAAYQINSLLALYELKLCTNQPFEAIRYFRQYYDLHLVHITEEFEKEKQLQVASSAVSRNAHMTLLKWVFWVALFMLLGALVWLKWSRYKLVLVSPDGLGSGKGVHTTFFTKESVGGIFKSTDKSGGDEVLTDEEILVDERKVELLAELRGKKILTEDDWVIFRQLFEMIHPDFLVHLRFRHKQVTPSEEKLACLIRLHFSTKEIAGLLAVSTHAVNVGRYRLKKRFGLESNLTLEEYLMGF
jgi:DNA-binding CsgD family transcriptional regulator